MAGRRLVQARLSRHRHGLILRGVLTRRFLREESGALALIKIACFGAGWSFPDPTTSSEDQFFTAQRIALLI